MSPSHNIYRITTLKAIVAAVTVSIVSVIIAGIALWVALDNSKKQTQTLADTFCGLIEPIAYPAVGKEPVTAAGKTFQRQAVITVTRLKCTPNPRDGK